MNYNKLEEVELILSDRANINKKDKYGKIALRTAVLHNCKEMVEFLLSHGTNIDEKDNNRETALHMAVHCNYQPIAELLLSHGVKINDKDYHKKQLFIMQNLIIINQFLNFFFHISVSRLLKIELFWHISIIDFHMIFCHFIFFFVIIF